MTLRSRARFPDVSPDKPHYESFYLKAARPDGELGLWIRHTVLKAPGGAPSASLWLTLFDRSSGPTALKAGFGADQLSTDPDTYIRIAHAALSRGRAAGAIDVPEAGSARWDLSFDAGEPPFYYLPRDWMYSRGLPRTKAIAIYPASRFAGTLVFGSREITLDGWPGMIGHNWGTEHAHQASWLQGTGFVEQPTAYLDAVFARIKIGPVVTPWIGNGCLCIDGQRHRLGGPRPGASSLTPSPTSGQFFLRGSGISVEGTVGAEAKRFVAWRYGEPGGGWHPTLNCSLADMRLAVRLGSEPPRELSATGGAAYELQLREAVPGMQLQPFPDP